MNLDLNRQEIEGALLKQQKKLKSDKSNCFWLFEQQFLCENGWQICQFM